MQPLHPTQNPNLRQPFLREAFLENGAPSVDFGINYPNLDKLYHILPENVKLKFQGFNFNEIRQTLSSVEPRFRLLRTLSE